MREQITKWAMLLLQLLIALLIIGAMTLTPAQADQPADGVLIYNIFH